MNFTLETVSLISV